MAQRPFDRDAFYAAIDSERRARSLTWKQVAAQAEVSASSLTRIAQGHRPDVDTLASLTAWAGVDANVFVGGGPNPAQSSAPLAITSYLRRDPRLSPDAAATLEEILHVSYARLATKPSEQHK